MCFSSRNGGLKSSPVSACAVCSQCELGVLPGVSNVGVGKRIVQALPKLVLGGWVMAGYVVILLLLLAHESQ